MIHGGDYTSYMMKYGKMPLDYSENTSPFDMPAGIKDAIIESLDLARRYPDPSCRELRSKIASHLFEIYETGISDGEIICGNGAADLIYRICSALKPKRALIFAPTFAEYEQALKANGCEVDYFLLDEKDDFKVGRELLKKIKLGYREDNGSESNYDAIFICQPNNPTGILTDKKLLLKILEELNKTASMLIIDECFLDFVDNFEKISLIKYINDSDNLFVLKAFTKLYSMAGVRLGYGVSSNEQLLKNMNSVGQTWPVSVMAQYAGLAALGEKEFVERVMEVVKSEKLRIEAFLEELDIRYIDAKANYILFYVDKPAFFDELMNSGLMIRDCSNYFGLSDGWYRIAIKGREDNDEMMKIFNRCYTELGD